MRNLNNKQGFTLVELLASVTIIGLLSTLAAPSLMWALERSQGGRCGTNLLLIENAKDAFQLDNPAAEISSPSQLLPYLKGAMPSCPAGGEYLNVTDRLKRCSCALNGKTGDKPADGIHDSGMQ